MSKKIAVVISGCGHLDGAEIRESIFTLLYLDDEGAEVQVFAPDKNQHHVVNHLTGEEASGESRNVLVEAARIARGEVKPLAEANHDEFNALIIPGGFGAAKNCSTIAFDVANASIDESFSNIINQFYDAGKPIGAICIAPAALAAALKDKTKAKVTLGDESNSELVEGLGGKHEEKNTDEICIDSENNIITTSAYMRDDRISLVSEGIKKLVQEVLKRS